MAQPLHELLRPFLSRCTWLRPLQHPQLLGWFGSNSPTPMLMTSSSLVSHTDNKHEGNVSRKAFSTSSDFSHDPGHGRRYLIGGNPVAARENFSHLCFPSSTDMDTNLLRVSAVKQMLPDTSAEAVRIASVGSPYVYVACTLKALITKIIEETNASWLTSQDSSSLKKIQVPCYPKPSRKSKLKGHDVT